MLTNYNYNVSALYLVSGSNETPHDAVPNYAQYGCRLITQNSGSWLGIGRLSSLRQFTPATSAQSQ